MTKRKIEISRVNKNGGCINRERHSWKVEYGDSDCDKMFIYSVDTYTCIKCGEIKNISHKELKAK